MFQIGNLIRQLRKEQKMTQEALGQGIISKAEVSKIEAGICIPDIFVLGALFQRLGKSLSPFEVLVTGQEYEKLLKGEYNITLQTVVVRESEYIKDFRESRGLSQKQFGQDVFARETISKIENGRASRQRKLQVLMERLGEPVEKYHGYIEANEYEAYELAEKYRLLEEQDDPARKRLQADLKRHLDMSMPVNRQFMESIDLLENRKRGELSAGEVLAGLEKCLRYTMPEYDGNIYRIPFRQEVSILQEIISCMEQVNRAGAAAGLAEKLLEKCEKKLKVS